MHAQAGQRALLRFYGDLSLRAELDCVLLWCVYGLANTSITRSHTACRSQIMRSRVECIHFAAHVATIMPCIYISTRTPLISTKTPAGIQTTRTVRSINISTQMPQPKPMQHHAICLLKAQKCGPGMEIKKDITKMQMETRSREKAKCPNAGNGENKCEEDLRR